MLTIFHFILIMYTMLQEFYFTAHEDILHVIKYRQILCILTQKQKSFSYKTYQITTHQLLYQGRGGDFIQNVHSCSSKDTAVLSTISNIVRNCNISKEAVIQNFFMQFNRKKKVKILLFIESHILNLSVHSFSID